MICYIIWNSQPTLEGTTLFLSFWMQLIESDDIISYDHKNKVKVQSLSILLGDRSFKTESQHLLFKKIQSVSTHIALL